MDNNCVKEHPDPSYPWTFTACELILCVNCDIDLVNIKMSRGYGTRFAMEPITKCMWNIIQI